MVAGELTVRVLTEGVHSGDASGIVPSSFRIMRQVLDRLEDSKTGRLLPASFHCEVPPDRVAQAQATANILGDEVYKRFPWVHADCEGAMQPALPTTIGRELATNPFLRPSSPEIQKRLGMEGRELWEVFGETRRRKDKF